MYGVAVVNAGRRKAGLPAADRFEAEDCMARKKISTTVYITQDQNEKLKLLNKKTKVPVAEYIREGIDLVLEKHKDHLPGQMSLVEKG